MTQPSSRPQNLCQKIFLSGSAHSMNQNQGYKIFCCKEIVSIGSKGPQKIYIHSISLLSPIHICTNLKLLIEHSNILSFSVLLQIFLWFHNLGFPGQILIKYLPSISLVLNFLPHSTWSVNIVFLFYNMFSISDRILSIRISSTKVHRISCLFFLVSRT